MRCALVLLLPAVWCATGLRGTAGEAFFMEKDGLVVIEVESAPPAKGWEEGTQLAGFTGRCYYTDKGGGGILSYKILIITPGRYELSIRNRHDFHDGTLQNDCWTRMDGGQKVKTFSSKRGEWTWQTRHEFNGGDKPQAAYDLDAGLHTFEISGRSSGFSIDRFHLYLANVKNTMDEKRPESRALPAMPELKVLPEVAGELKQGNLGKAMLLTERAAKSKAPTEQEEATRAMDAIRGYVAGQREALTRLKPTAPEEAAQMLGALAQEFAGSQLGQELARDARAWAQEPATRQASQARLIYEQIAKMAEPMVRRKDSSRAKLSTTQQQQLVAIRQGTLLLKQRYPETPACTKAVALARELGFEVPD